MKKYNITTLVTQGTVLWVTQGTVLCVEIVTTNSVELFRLLSETEQTL